MRHFIHRPATRRGAAVTAYIGLCLLAVGLSLPVMSVTSFGEAVPYSAFRTIAAIAGRGDYVLAGLILLFSMVFPAVKLIATLLIGLSLDGMPTALRWRIVATFNRFGKYSMLDVFIIAVLIVVFKVQGIVSASLEYGFYFFLAGILASSLSSGMLLMAIPEATAALAENANPPAPTGPKPGSGGAGTRRWAPLLRLGAVVLVGLLLLVAGLMLAVLAPPGTVDHILVQKRPGVDLKIVSLPDAPDYMLEIKLKDGWKHRTKTMADTPIGNGIVFELPAIEISDIEEILLWDDNSFDVSDLKLSVIPDEIVDRVRVQGERSLAGEKMRFELIGQRSPGLLLGYLVIIASAALLLITGALMILRLGRAGRH